MSNEGDDNNIITRLVENKELLKQTKKVKSCKNKKKAVPKCIKVRAYFCVMMERTGLACFSSWSAGVKSTG